MRSHLILGLSAVILLAGCGDKGTVAYSVALKESGVERADDLFAATMRVVERRIEAVAAQQNIKDPLEDIAIERNGTEATITLKLSNTGINEMLRDDLTQSFTFRFMKEVPLEEAEVVVAETEGFSALPLTEEHLAWVDAKGEGQDPGSAVLHFTAEGQELEQQIFSEHTNENIGIFVRGMPVYKFLVEEADLNQPTLSMNIPNAELAQVFADDMNVSLHTTIAPLN